MVLSQSFAVPSSLLVKMDLPSGLKCACDINWDCRKVSLAGRSAGKSQRRTAGSCEDTSNLVPSGVAEAVASNPTCRIIGQTVWPESGSQTRMKLPQVTVMRREPSWVNSAVLAPVPCGRGARASVQVSTSQSRTSPSQQAVASQRAESSFLSATCSSVTMTGLSRRASTGFSAPRHAVAEAVIIRIGSNGATSA